MACPPFRPRFALALISLSLLSPVLHAVTPDPFIPYPATDNCGPKVPVGANFKPTCPVAVCAAERAACADAMQARKQCLKDKCPAETMAQVYTNARAACDASVGCVQSVCYSTFPAKANGHSCKVRSYHKGECCCATCQGQPLFKTVEGEFRAIAVDPRRGLRPGECAIIDGQTDLSGIIMGDNNAKVFSVCLKPIKGIYSYQVEVDGQGPKGWLSGFFYLYFSDQSPDTYELKLWSSARDSHEVSYNSNRPDIVEIRWSGYTPPPPPPDVELKGVVVLSDIHIGDNSPTCWYQKSVHEPYLLKILDTIIANNATVTELVLAGDVFDQWTYPFHRRPPTIQEIIAANPKFFNKLKDVLGALNGKVSYLRGNHDMMTTQADIASIRSSKGHSINFVGDVYNPVGDKRFVVAHGHLFCMFNAPDPTTPWNPLPLGHFITRMVATKWDRTLPPGRTVADLVDQGAPSGKTFWGILEGLRGLSMHGAAGYVIKDLSDELGIGLGERIVLPDGSQTTLNEVMVVYDGLATRWIVENGDVVAFKAAVADFTGLYMGFFAQRLAFQESADLVLFGHTHTPMEGLDKSLVDYSNSGFTCPAQVDMASGAKQLTFVAVELPANPGAPPTHHLYRVTMDGSNDTPKVSMASAGKDVIVADISVIVADYKTEDFSVYTVIDNTQGKSDLILRKHLLNGDTLCSLHPASPQEAKVSFGYKTPHYLRHSLRVTLAQRVELSTNGVKGHQSASALNAPRCRRMSSLNMVPGASEQ